ncbi:hypothetical protein GGF42_005036 [Coemansia sp. RSA 2424]|nr:hypothetical protein GGF42_005036 [Coemansia sp. RSA 2424]
MAGVPIPIVQHASAIAAKFELRLKQKQLANTTPQADTEACVGSDDVCLAPLSVQSDFANLLRMAALQSSRMQPSICDDSDSAREAEEEPVGGAQSAKKANENQFWSCIVDHLRRTMASSSN